MVGAKWVKLQAAHTKLPHSKAFVIQACRLQTHEMVFDAVAEAFRVLGGGIFDKMRTAVDRIGVASPGRSTRALQPWPATLRKPASGWEEGNVPPDIEMV